MNSTLAVRLLRTVMAWDETTMGPEQSALISTMSRLAEYKYNAYQQYAPGRQFVESLALWLEQFNSLDREVALDFVHRKLIFISDQEMRHLVDLTFRNVVRPILREKVAKQLDLPLWQTAGIDDSDAFANELRHSLFLGLSDGARIDEFRRSASLSNDQAHATYELQTDRAQDMVKALGGPFRNVFLVDDFYGSGKSILRWQLDDKWLDKYEPGASSKGRLIKFVEQVISQSQATTAKQHLANFLRRVALQPKFGSIFSDDVAIYTCIYVATERALNHIRSAVGRHPVPPWQRAPEVHATMTLDDRVSLRCGSEDVPFDALLHKHYRDSLMNKHRSVGGSDIIHGFSNGGLPLVFTHNTPNNTVYLIWETGAPYTALFPRVDRHKAG